MDGRDMDHLDEDRLLDLLTEPATKREEEHLARCPRCREALASWEETRAALRELDSQELSESEIHHLRVLFRQLGPSPVRRRWIARLVRPSAPLSQAVATRGALTPSLSEYQAGQLSLILRVSPSRGKERYDVHGTIQGEGTDRLQGSAVVLFSDEGFGDVAEPDSLGEFHFHDVPTGRYHMSWALEDGRVDVEDIAVGKTEDEPDA